MATTESYRELLRLLGICSKLVGVEIWTAPGKFRPASYYLSFHVIVYFVCTIYTLHKYSNDPLHMMKVLITLGTAVQLYIKFFVMISSGPQFKEFTELIEEHLLEPFQRGNQEEVAVLQRTGRIIWIIFRLMYTSFSSTPLIFGAYSLYTYYADDVLMPLFLYELPCYDWSTTGGYVANMLFQVNLLTIGIVGAVASDFMFIMCILYTLAYAEIFMVHLRELKALLDEQVFPTAQLSAIHPKWMQCMRGHQRSVSFLNTMEDLFKLNVLVQVGMGIFSLCDGMLLITLTDWYAAYFFMMVIFFELALYFLVGHYVELKVDEMYETINSVPWYKLPVNKQKEFSFLLCRQQRPLTLTIYGFAPLNLTVYMDVLKKLYQFFVLIIQYVD